MTHKEIHYKWEFDLRSTPQEIWPLLADTNRFNRDVGIPAVFDRATAASEPAHAAVRLIGARHLRLSKFGIGVEWEEEPFEWVRPERFGVMRRYAKGPIAEIRIRVEILARSAGGSHVNYEVWARPASALGVSAIRFQIGLLGKRSFAKTIRAYDQSAAHRLLYTKTNAVFTKGGRDRLALACAALAAQGTAAELIQLLRSLLEDGDDISLTRLRPHELADYWLRPRLEVLELCLRATRLGLLDLQWDIICPHCRGAAQTSKLMSNLDSSSFCTSCNIDFAVEFERSVELTFKPNAAIRHIELKQFCVGGPQVTPHIVAQLLVQPHTERNITLPLEPGQYRLRARAESGGMYLNVAAQGAAELDIELAAGWSSAAPLLGTNPTLRLRNGTDHVQQVMLERMAWADNAATAAEVTSLQIFRDLFATESLRPGELISVGTLAILFTDLRGSTQLYRDIGDAPAFGRVMKHFDVLRETIRACDGALVKTIGDAVMAVFKRPSDALSAILQAQARLAAPPAGEIALTLKAGIHCGACIAVTLNDRLDYFGCTVNLAARLEGLSSGSDVIISEAVRNDPEIAAQLADAEAALNAEPFDILIKGFGAEKFQLWRVRVNAQTAAASLKR